MYPLFESIRWKDGAFDLLPYHQARLDHSMRLLFPAVAPWNLQELLGGVEKPGKGLWKCRFPYGLRDFKVEFESYRPQKISRLHVRERPDLIYPFKYSDRRLLHSLKRGLPEGDEVIITAGGRLKDSSYANLALWDGEEWHTPMYPLFYGVRRASLLDCGLLKISDIHLEDLKNFRCIRLINAMLPMDEAAEISVENIQFKNGEDAQFR